MPTSFSLLESHTVLSAMLSGASGIMAYTSISVLTKESTDYLSRVPEWPLLAKYPGAVTAALFIVGAHLNLLLVRLVSRIMPSDSPIKHACASHPPSPSESQLERGSSTAEVGYCAQHVPTPSSRSSDCHLERTVHSESCSSEQLPLLPQLASHSTRASPECRRCEYACNESACYRLEHCHITPLYPHMHTHEHAGQSAQAHPSGSCCRGVAAVSPVEYHHKHQHLRVLVGSGNDDGCEAVAAHSHEGHIGHTHHVSAAAAHVDDPKAMTAAQLSSRHHRMLIHVGLQTAVAIALHKVPEGLIIYLSRQASPRLGLSVAASLFAHNLPEGLMLALPLFLATRRRHTAFVVSSLMGAVPPAIGAALGMLAVGDSSNTGHDRSGRLSGIFGIA
ncbi:Zinc transporter, partial [Coemansia aciculifera]